MRLFELKVAVESGWYFMEELGQSGLVEIIPQEYERFKKNIYAEQVEVCREMSARLDFIESICTTLNLPINRAPDQLEDLQDLYFRSVDRREETETSRHTVLGSIADTVNGKERGIRELFQNYDHLKTKREQTVEQYHALRILSRILPTSDVILRSADSENEENRLETFGFYYLCGTIDAKDAYRLQRYVFRISRENVIFQMLDLSFEGDRLKPIAAVPARKIYFIVFQAGSSPTMRQKIRDGLKTFNSTPVRLPLYYSKIGEANNYMEEEFRNIEDLIGRTLTKLQSSLAYFTDTRDSGVAFLEECRMRIGKELKIYEELNKFKLEDKILSAWVWVPAEETDSLKKKITHIVSHSQNIKAYILDASYTEQRIVPPTFFKLSDVTRPFQEIVDTYGVPRFEEVNPGLLTIVTFPYLFGIMFGDIGHGGLLLLIGWILVKYSEVFKQKGFPLINYRFLFFGLGFFACFCGIIYNDFLGIPWKLFPSCYTRTHKRFERDDPECTYWMGFDSVWAQSKQEISFANSFKMKLSIIVGVIHMCTGIVLKGVNSLHFGRYSDFLFEFLPQLIFMLCTFGYMCFAIVAKWLIDWGDGSKAPSIISLFINIGYTAPGEQFFGDDQGLQQTMFQQNLFLIAFLCVPVMLLPKPIILWFQNRGHSGHEERRSKNLVEILEHSNDPKEKLLAAHEGSSQPGQDVNLANKMPNPHAMLEEHHDIGEIFIHQMIETIEFVLGSISNTASYLRLWALSLAHGQLARVFLDMTVLNSLKGGSPVAAVAGFPIFVGATVGVLMSMDLMECFLHTLRLHWVEFQNKFYKGDGYKFTPFNIVESIKEYLDTSRVSVAAQT
jgi:V-type H+-transporting ATPase subunit a